MPDTAILLQITETCSCLEYPNYEAHSLHPAGRAGKVVVFWRSAGKREEGNTDRMVRNLARSSEIH